MFTGRSTPVARNRHAGPIAFALLMTTAVATVSACGTADSAPESGSRPTVKLALNPAQLQYLPIMLAIDRGYFRDAGVNVELTTYQGSANNQIPLLARGDIDLSPAVSGPSLFNQYDQGFRIKLLANLTAPRKGYRDGSVLVVRKDRWDTGEIRSPKDLEGRRVDGSAEGNPADFLMRQTLLSAGVEPADVKLEHRARTPVDSVEFLRNRTVEATVISEPAATLAEVEGLGVRWLGYNSVVPWYQETFLAASEKFAAERPDDARKVLGAYLRAVKEVNASHGSWTPELLALAAKWTKQKQETLNAVGGLMYYTPDGAVDEKGLAKVQDFWSGEKLVPREIPVGELVDTTALSTATGGSR
ncbi:ABC transporter substrate-binding protein [Streptomyces sp. NPDC001970]